MAGELTRCAEQVISGAVTFPNTWGRVFDIVGELDGASVDPWVFTAWLSLSKLHQGECLAGWPDLLAAMSQIASVPKPGTLEEWGTCEKRRFSDVHASASYFGHPREVIGAAERLSRLRANLALGGYLGSLSKHLQRDSLGDPFVALDSLSATFHKHHRRSSRVELGNAAERAERALQATRPAAIPTGFAALDDIACGVDIGELTLIGARTGGGKSTLLAAIARNQIFPESGRHGADMIERAQAASAPGPHVLVVSCENSTDMFFQRLACDMLDIPGSDMRRSTRGALDKNDTNPATLGKSEFLEALRQHKRLTVIDESDTRDVEISTIRAAIEAWADDAEADDPDAAKLVLIDYFQRIDPGQADAKEPRYRQVELIAKSLKGIARTRQLAVVLAVQLNDTPGNAEPRRDSTRDSRGGNSEAANVWLLHSWTGEQRERLAASGKSSSVLDCMSLLSDKGRSTGEGWRVMLTFEGEHYRIIDAPDDTNHLLDPNQLKIATPKAPRSPKSGR